VLEASCAASGLALTVLGLGQVWKGFGMKLILVANHLERVAADTLVLFVDAYDVVILGGCAQMSQRFLSFGTPIVFSAELGCWPRGELAPRYPPPRPRGARRMERRVRSFRPPPPLNLPQRYLNSGSYMGYAGSIREAIQELSPHYEDDDQELFSRYYLEHPQRATLDHESMLFQTLYGISPDDLVFDLPGSWRPRYRRTGWDPCLLHGNGYGMDTFTEVLHRLRARGWPGSWSGP
jgi:hypothetical protein